MKTDKPFQKSFLCAGVLFVVLFAAAALISGKTMVNAVITAFLVCLAIAVATAVWCRLSKASWSFTRFVATVMGLFLAYVFAASLLRKIVASMMQGQ